MAVYQYKFGPFTQADGAQTILLPQASRQYFNHAITIAYPSGELPSSGTILMQARRSGGTFFEDLDTNSTIDATKTANFPVIEDAIDALMATPSGLPSGMQYWVSVNSFGGQ